MTAGKLAILGALAASVAACNPILTAESPSPPGRSARLDPVYGFWDVKSYRLELSQGAAIAISCSRGATCEHMTVVSDDPAIAEIRGASFGVLHHAPLGNNAQTVAALVVVGRAAGTTHVHVHAEQGDRDVAVTIVPQPAPKP